MSDQPESMRRLVDFEEDDEPVEHVVAVFNAADKDLTSEDGNELVTLTVSTRHPEKWELIDHETGQHWVIVDGAWRQIVDGEIVWGNERAAE